MTHDALFGELRSILQNPASQETWVALCEHLDLWSPEALEDIALPYALDIVGRWPAELEREVPQRWAAKLLEGQAVAQLAAANKLYLNGDRRSAAQLTASLATPHLSGLTRLAVRWAEEAAAGAMAVASAPHLTNLTHLELSYCTLGASGAAALASAPHLSGLTHLSLSNSPLQDDGVAALAASPHLSNLASLNLSALPSRRGSGIRAGRLATPRPPDPPQAAQQQARG
jgi:hypothetical protein